jgi:hypothetical protein
MTLRINVHCNESMDAFSPLQLNSMKMSHVARNLTTISKTLTVKLNWVTAVRAAARYRMIKPSRNGIGTECHMSFTKRMVHTKFYWNQYNSKRRTIFFFSNLLLLRLKLCCHTYEYKWIVICYNCASSYIIYMQCFCVHDWCYRCAGFFKVIQAKSFLALKPLVGWLKINAIYSFSYIYVYILAAACIS